VKKKVLFVCLAMALMVAPAVMLATPVAADPSIDVDIDIKPGSFPNSLNLKANGLIPVAILGGQYFDVTSIDVTQHRFQCLSPAHDLTDPDVYMDHLQDVNLDGYLDLVAHYKTQDTCIGNSQTVACTYGRTTDGTYFEGCDSVNIVKGR